MEERGTSRSRKQRNSTSLDKLRDVKESIGLTIVKKSREDLLLSLKDS